MSVFLVVVLIGGSNFVAVRFSNQELAPFWGAGIRFAAAALLLFALTAVKGLALPRGTALLATLLYGTLNFGASYAFIYWGLVEAPAALAAVLVALTPLLTLLLARAYGLEALSWRRAIAALIAAAGVAVVFADQIITAVSLVSVLVLLAGTLCIAESTVLAKRLPRLHPLAINAVAMVPGALLLIMLSAAAGEVRSLPIREATWIALAYLVTAGSVGLFVG
ncbi:MAG: EamA family transporter, partial [Chloroflexi bacterium]|nr:EamA family transporter [Chloroflexota bacterium]